MCFDDSMLSAHCEAPSQSGSCEACFAEDYNLRMNNQICRVRWSGKPLSLGCVASYNKVFRLGILLIDSYIQLVGVIPAFHIFHDRLRLID